MKKRLYISADIEGICGVVSTEHLMPGGFEYQQAREWMTAEVVAVCEAAFEQGIDEVVVSDSHGNGQNILLDQLPANVELVRSWPRPLGMMEGIQHGDYVGAVLLGYHTGASDLTGVLAHTLHGGAITEVCLNGQAASETVISAAIAAHYGVPVIMVSGDDAYTKHACEVLSTAEWNINRAAPEAVMTKWALSFTSACMLSPKQVQTELALRLKTALSRLLEFELRPLSGQVQLDIRCIKRQAVELLSYLPMIERIDAHTIRFQGKDMIEVSRLLIFVCFSGALTPK